MKRFVCLLGMVALLACSSPQSPYDFIMKAENGHFVDGAGQTYYFTGTNFWYGGILASTGRGGDWERLRQELDTLQALGIDNLRVMVGSDGKEGVMSKVTPCLQTAPGVYNDTLWVGLDRLMTELGRRRMKAVLFINNSWEWTGGYGQYLEWAGAGPLVIPRLSTWEEYCAYSAQFFTIPEARSLFKQHVGRVVSRINSITGKPYAEDPALFSWQIGNEPRCFAQKNKAIFAEWIRETAAYIKSLDPNHMVSIGSEGLYGCEGDMDLYETICGYPEIDYMNIHIWPFNWNWTQRQHPEAGLSNALEQTRRYLDLHLAVARRLNKPLVIEEYGFPRDGLLFTPGSPTTGRDAYYAFIADAVLSSARKGDVLCGSNCWAWGGFAVPRHLFWEPGDPYLGDPAQEEQGLNAVFISDTVTLRVLEANAKSLRNL